MPKLIKQTTGYLSRIIKGDKKYAIHLNVPGVILIGESEKLPESYVIFITENDIYKKGKPLYKIDRYVDGEQLFNDEAHIIYVNGQYKGDDPIGDLMHDFHCKKADDMKNKILADRARYLKEDEKGVKHMCRIMEQMAKEERAERDLEIATKLLEQGKLSDKEIAELLNLTEKQMKAIKEKVAVLA